MTFLIRDLISPNFDISDVRFGKLKTTSKVGATSESGLYAVLSSTLTDISAL